MDLSHWDTKLHSGGRVKSYDFQYRTLVIIDIIIVVLRQAQKIVNQLWKAKNNMA